jgi:hsp33 protein
VDTKLVLAADDKTAGGVFLQKMPAEGGKLPADYDPEGWQRLTMFAGTVKSAELLTLSPEDINRRLFWEESPLVTHEAAPHFACTCSKARFDDLVRSLGREEVEAIIREKGALDVACRFCGAKAHYDAIDAAALFTPGVQTQKA